MKQPIPLLSSPAHAAHAPRVEFNQGRLLDYPEIPRRVDVIQDHLLKAGLATLYSEIETLPREALLAVHDAGMLDYLEWISHNIQEARNGAGRLYALDSTDDYRYPSVFPARPHMTRLHESQHGRHGSYFFDTDAPVGEGTWKAALAAASVAYAGANRLLDGENAVYALCRPPGHHAGRDFMGGYCYINNAAVAAHHLKRRGKVAIIDIDYHHGNGTQDIFWDDSAVLFASIHGHPDHEYPYYSGHADETGGAAQSNLNHPLLPDASESDFLAAFDHILERTREFGAWAVVLSLGFDAFQDDPMSTFQVKRETYQTIGARLQGLGLPLLIVQEGGYQVDSLGELAERLLMGLLPE